MINRKIIQKQQALDAIQNGEFESSIISSKDRVVIVLTQDWCPQWQNMKSWIYESTDADIDIYELEYNKEDYSDEFRSFKEEKLGNEYVPYLRFYKNGVLIEETNFISKDRFVSIIGE
ncbi:MAG TPA: hypothetical protein VHP38_10555 [Ruminiclostridium sp.]|nr:hypothetical protein [Ruminiclostridium sp.]